MKNIESGLFTAAGLSDKALVYLNSEDKTQAMQRLIQEFLKPAGPKFVEELVFRFLLIRGDALGGSMRNFGGLLAQEKLTRVLLDSFNAGRYCLSLARWQELADGSGWRSKMRIRLEGYAGIHWRHSGGDRTLVYNLTVPLVKNNVDLCLFNLSPEEVAQSRCCAVESYLALGELKGGIDPAGADEHWKTARTALGRIREAFSAGRLCATDVFSSPQPSKRSMAGEIWSALEVGVLSNAANLTERQSTCCYCGLAVCVCEATDCDVWKGVADVF